MPFWDWLPANVAQTVRQGDVGAVPMDSAAHMHAVVVTARYVILMQMQMKPTKIVTINMCNMV